MITYKLKIKSYSNKDLISKIQLDYSYAFRKLYSNFDKVKDKIFVNNLCVKYNLDTWQFESLKTEVESKINKTNTIKANNIIQQEEIKLELENLKNSRKDKRKKFRLLDKLRRINNFTDIVFGTKVLLRRLSDLSNNKEKNKKEIEEVRKEYRKNRILPVFIGGETYHNGNRKIDFEFLENNKVVFKPIFKTKIDIEFICSEKQYKTLLQIQELTEQKYSLPISVRLSTEYVWITFDEEKLNGFGLNVKEMKAELKLIPKECKEIRKEIAIKYYREQENRKLEGKLKYRYLAVDLNPQYIGWSICDKVNNEIRIVEKNCYDLTELSKKLELSSDHPLQIYQNNKRKHEISNIVKDLFTKAVYYKTAYFVMEDLNFKSEVVNEFSKEFNRKVRNIWHRGLTCSLINKYCNCLGIQKIEVNPCYSSFIGNIQYNYFDPINASLEICRRGMFKFEKCTFFPKVTEENHNTMSRLVYKSRDVRDKTELLREVKSLTNWKDFFNLFSKDGCKVKYRRSLDDLKEPFERFSLFSLKSKILLYKF